MFCLLYDKFFVSFKSVGVALGAHCGSLSDNSLATTTHLVLVWMRGHVVSDLLPCRRVALIHWFRELDGRASRDLFNRVGDGLDKFVAHWNKKLWRLPEGSPRLT